jgi:hypothetical protein
MPLTQRDFLFRKETPDQELTAIGRFGVTDCVDGQDEHILVCKDPDYDINEYFNTFSAEERAALGLETGEQAFKVMFEHGIFGVGPALDPATPQRFLELANASGVPLHGK